MSKSNGTGTKNDPIVVSINHQTLATEDPREFVIKGCTIKDEKPQYSFEKLKNPGKGNLDNVKGAMPVHEDMIDVIKRLNVHMACIDDAFLRTDIKVASITSKLANNELVKLYTVTGFKITGKDDDERVSLIGKKYLEVGGYAQFNTPEVLMSKFSSYKPWKDLKEVIDEWRAEVELYHNEGKCMPVEEEEVINPNQGTLDLKENEEVDSEFAKAKV